MAYALRTLPDTKRGWPAERNPVRAAHAWLAPI